MYHAQSTPLPPPKVFKFEHRPYSISLPISVGNILGEFGYSISFFQMNYSTTAYLFYPFMQNLDAWVAKLACKKMTV